MTSEPADPEFRDWFEARLKAYKKPASKIIKLGETHKPMIFVFFDSDSLAIAVPLDRLGFENKGVIMQFHQHLASIRQVYASMLIMEAWTLSMGKQGMADPTESIEHHPDREEAILVNALHGRQQLIATVKIDRQTRSLGKTVIIDPADGYSSGRMILHRPTKH
jgi:hypothetical protein